MLGMFGMLGLPGTFEMVGLFGMLGLPGTFEMSEMSEIPGVADVSEIPEAPGISGMPGVACRKMYRHTGSRDAGQPMGGSRKTDRMRSRK